jgi:hypothetical protein
MASVFPGEQANPGGGANGTSGIKVREAQTFLCQPVYVGRGEALLAQVAQIAIAQVIAQKQDDIGSVYIITGFLTLTAA